MHESLNLVSSNKSISEISIAHQEINE